MTVNTFDRVVVSCSRVEDNRSMVHGVPRRSCRKAGARGARAVHARVIELKRAKKGA